MSLIEINAEFKCLSEESVDSVSSISHFRAFAQLGRIKLGYCFKKKTNLYLRTVLVFKKRTYYGGFNTSNKYPSENPHLIDWFFFWLNIRSVPLRPPFTGFQGNGSQVTVCRQNMADLSEDQ